VWYVAVVDGLDPDEMRALVGGAKKQLRRKMRALRGALPQAAVDARSARIVQHLLELVPIREAAGVALFAPMTARREVDLGQLDRTLRDAGKRLFYPFMDPTGDGYRTGFRRVDRIEGLADRGRGFPEPPADAPDARAGDVDVLVVPALALSENGHRLGYGIGFHDATLPDLCPPAVAVAVGFGFQLIVEVPLEPHDFRCDWVVTDERVIEVSRDRAVTSS
jgi:5-formyltetrahydrofolate cyclo-ligase